MFARLPSTAAHATPASGLTCWQIIVIALAASVIAAAVIILRDRAQTAHRAGPFANRLTRQPRLMLGHQSPTHVPPSSPADWSACLRRPAGTRS